MVTRGPGVDPIEAGLSPAPHAEAGRELLVDRPGQGQAAVDEAVAVMEADHAALEIGIER